MGRRRHSIRRGLASYAQYARRGSIKSALRSWGSKGLDEDRAGGFLMALTIWPISLIEFKCHEMREENMKRRWKIREDGYEQSSATHAISTSQLPH
jgi:hypothetical protein